jgi:hypothetical protein
MGEGRERMSRSGRPNKTCSLGKSGELIGSLRAWLFGHPKIFPPSGYSLLERPDAMNGQENALHAADGIARLAITAGPQARPAHFFESLAHETELRLALARLFSAALHETERECGGGAEGQSEHSWANDESMFAHLQSSPETTK